MLKTDYLVEAYYNASCICFNLCKSKNECLNVYNDVVRENSNATVIARAGYNTLMCNKYQQKY